MACDDAIKALRGARNKRNGSVSDGEPLADADLRLDDGEANKLGVYALDQIDLVNLLCVPQFGAEPAWKPSTLGKLAGYCARRRAFLLLDPPLEWSRNGQVAAALKDGPVAAVGALGVTGASARNAAVFFPRLKQVNPLTGALEEFPPCGTIAGVFARTDAARHVWKAPAGLETTLVGTVGLGAALSDADSGLLNPVGINCLRSFPTTGIVVWGARTLRGADRLDDEYKYIPVRRLALFIEESLLRGTQWACFEPNDEPLWSQLRLSVGGFLQDLFQQGAFQGNTPTSAYFVKCGANTTTQADINRGVVNIVVGFAPVYPAEFIIIQLQQLAGQLGHIKGPTLFSFELWKGPTPCQSLFLIPACMSRKSPVASTQSPAWRRRSPRFSASPKKGT